MSYTIHFRTLVASESVWARRTVREFAETTFVEQRKAWESQRGTEGAKARPPTWDECVDKSREVRRRRERRDNHNTRQITRHDNL